MIPLHGLEWSPLLKYPHNAPCFCGSQKKFKKCHKDHIKLAVTPEEVEQLRKYVAIVKEQHSTNKGKSIA